MADAKAVDLEKGGAGDKCPAEKRSFTEEEVSPEVPRKKMSFGFTSTKSKSDAPKIQMKLNGVLKAKPAPIKMALGPQKLQEAPKLKPKTSLSVKQAFNADDDSDEEEMPFEAKMRMRNVGRETPTAAGPNSFGKGRNGFSDRRAVYKKTQEELMDKVSGE